MDYKELLKIIIDLKIGENKNIYRIDNTDLWIHRPEKLGRSLKSKEKYEIKTNFQIFMRGQNGKAFKPNHLRILIDLHLKLISNPNSAKKLFDILEDIYNGKDPLEFKNDLSKMNFKMQLDSALINVCCAQLFMAEQDINYTKGKIQPPRSFLMGYIRFIKAGQENIDKILWSSIRHPPRKEFRE
ncbi:hypothetical protein HYX15_03970 [Candidatus Woesearchaeota archaeon]|nr:hypothetical protein [Candidatus Woesearchaeota archaeon]